MLRISKLADYGVSLMVFLAQHDNQTFNSKAIAQATHIALPTVSKLLKKLALKGLLESMRGTSGGYKLKKDAALITIADIIQSLETQYGITECTEHGSNCQLQNICNMKRHWQIINNTIYATLAAITIASLVDSSKNIGVQYG